MTIDTNSLTWQEIKEFVEKQIQDLRELNDTDKPEKETHGLRGEIKAYQCILALGEDKEDVIVGDTGYIS